MDTITILKLGGSVITEKNRTDYTVRADLLSEVFLELKHARDVGLAQNMILVHGAGGHIHHLAHTFDLKSGAKDNKEQYRKGLHVQEVCKRLNADVIKIGTAASLPLVGVPTHTIVQNKDTQIEHCDIKAINNILASNQIPVLYGDMVPDVTLGLSICSGDAVLAHLARSMEVSRAFFASDIDGIFTSDPHNNPNAKLIENVSLANLETEQIVLTGSHNVDTTGGLKGKLNACADLFDHTTHLKKIEIFNGLTPENFEKVFDDVSFPHTTVTK